MDVFIGFLIVAVPCLIIYKVVSGTVSSFFEKPDTIINIDTQDDDDDTTYVCAHCCENGAQKYSEFCEECEKLYS